MLAEIKKEQRDEHKVTPDNRSEGAKLAEAHWEYIESILAGHRVDANTLAIARLHYKTAFIHGYKHGQQAHECLCQAESHTSWPHTPKAGTGTNEL